MVTSQPHFRSLVWVKTPKISKLLNQLWIKSFKTSNRYNLLKIWIIKHLMTLTKTILIDCPVSRT